MPFQVFRRHQRKMMAALAIFAMVAFSLDFSLLRNQLGGVREDPVVANLYGKRIRRSDLGTMQLQRSRANRFVSLLNNRPYTPVFGELTDRAMVDALILQHEADRLGIPADKELGSAWLQEHTNPPLTTEQFVRVYREHFSKEVTDTQLLEDIANQVRLGQVQRLPGVPIVTPYDLFQAYRDQNERVSVYAVAFPVEDFVKDAPKPSDPELQAFFDLYKDKLPDRTSDQPGFKIPRRVQVEYVSADLLDRARKIEDKLTDKELRDVFTTRAKDFPVPPPELPKDLFAGDPDAKLTPAGGDDFLKVRDMVLRTVARERAQEEVERLFGQIQDDVMLPFSEKFGAVQDANQDAEKEGKAPQSLPQPGDAMQKAAAKLALQYDATGPLDHDAASTHGQIAAAHHGGSEMGGGTSFADEFFDPRQPLFQQVELSDDAGHRYLAWKTADLPERVPTLSEVRDEVVHVYQFQEARKLAEKAAQDFAKKVEANGYDLPKTVDKQPVITTSPVSRLQSGAMLNPYQPEPSRPSEIMQIPDAGTDLRNALFGIELKQVKVAPNQPKSIYYVMTLNQRMPVGLAGLYGSFGPRYGLQNEVLDDSLVTRIRSWMDQLRTTAGLPANWIPPDESRAERRKG